MSEGLARVHRWLAPSTYLLVTLQGLLIVTGGAVRLSGSGLGCPTWPECTDGSITPVHNQLEGPLHSWIEFGNRLLTFLLFFAAIATLALVIKAGRSDLRLLALSQIGGIFAQGILGGITVLTDLNPLAVASHFLLSIALLAAAITLNVRATRHVRHTAKVSPITRFHVTLTLLVIVVGTLVTGTGPHAGDAQAPRLHLNLPLIAKFHGVLVALLIVLTSYLYTKSTNTEMKKWLSLFLIIATAQGALGVIQYLQGVPQLLVALHLVGATLTWLAAWRIFLSQKFATTTN